MATRTLETGYFGSVGMGDPQSSFVERTLGVSWDFGKKSVTNNVSGGAVKVIPLMEIPKGFCIDRISVVQTEFVNSDVTLTFGLASTDSYTVGGNFALTASNTKLRSSQAPKTVAAGGDLYAAEASAGSPTKKFNLPATESSLFVNGADTLCMIVPTAASSTEVTFNKGAFDLCIHGFEVFAEGEGANALNRANYRDTMQTSNNVSGGMWPLD